MRKTRDIKPNASYHVIARVNRKELILNNSEIKEMFLEVIRRSKKKFSFIVKNFCIMGNHVHLIVKPMKKESLSRIMQWILSVFAIKFNKMFNYIGHVWYDRFKSKIINNFLQYLRTFVYISNNPIRAKIVKNAVDFEYNGISFIQKGFLDILERPSNKILKKIWFLLKQETRDGGNRGGNRGH